mgnify:CR=1 FL=1
MGVNLRRFVDVNVRKTSRSTINPTRDTAVLFCSSYASITKTMTFVSAGYVSENYVLVADDNTALTIAKADLATDEFYPYARKFFDNGGIKLEANHSDFTLAALQALGNEKMIVAKLGGLTAADVAIIKSYNDASAYADTSTSNVPTNAYGPSKKLFFSNIAYASASKTFDKSAYTESNIALKAGDAGIEMTAMAYLTKINVYGENTVHDYAFTIEAIDGLSASTYAGTSSNLVIDDDEVGLAMSSNILIDTILASQIRNVGGNLVDGNDLVNAYVLIILQQTLQEALINVLTTKLSGAEGTVVIYNAMVAELNKYVACGFLSTGNWDDEPWTVTYNEQTYIIIDAKERLTTGYKAYVIPYAAMTSADIQAHKAPPVYVALNNAYGIRKITVEGKVL